MKEIRQVVQSYRMNKSLRQAVVANAAVYEPVQKYKVTLVYLGDLIIDNITWIWFSQF